jgi:hypothetical protein
MQSTKKKSRGLQGGARAIGSINKRIDIEGRTFSMRINNEN